jgi:hypothetical protein
MMPLGVADAITPTATEALCIAGAGGAGVAAVVCTVASGKVIPLNVARGICWFPLEVVPTHNAFAV